MPTYQYRCTSCDRELEVVQKFTDDPMTDCPECDGNLRKVFNAVGVVFKGSGFYATDNRTKGKSAAARAAEKAEGRPATETKPATDAKPKSETKPAASTGASSAA